MNYRRSFEVEAPLAAVARFHAETSALKSLTPPPIVMQPRSIEPLAEGSSSEFVLWLGPIPVRWVARHRDVGPEGFVDEQVKGPFKRWIHQHRFEARSDRVTLVTDEIEAELGCHPWWWIIGASMWLGLPALFAYRAWRTRRQVARMMRGNQP